MKPTDFAIRLTQFFGEYLPAQRDVSPNTIKGYRDAFTLLLRYCRDQCHRAPEKVTLDSFDVPLLLAFLDYLQTARHCRTRTRNHRLCAVHAFFRYLQTEAPERMLQCQQILAIPLQRAAPPPVHYLSRESLTALLAQPDLTTSRGLRDAALLSLLYDSGARVQELIDLCVHDVRLDAPAQIRLTGKGRKTRIVPLLSNMVELLEEYLREHRLNRADRVDSPLFFNQRGEPLSRSGVRYILEQYTEQARPKADLLLPRVTPHTLRHSKAMHLLQAGNPAPVIQAILGHADIRTTNIYAQADLEMKRRALEKAASTTSPPSALPSWQEDKSLMNWLRSL